MKTFFFVVNLFVKVLRNLRKKHIHIVSLLLLVSFPITAIDLHFSIFKCKHKGLFHVVLFDQHIHNGCCVASTNDKTNIESVNTHDCCHNTESKAPKHQTGGCSHEKRKDVVHSTILSASICSSCCSEKHFKLSLQNTIIPSENAKKIIFPIEKQSKDYFKYSFVRTYFNKDNYKDILYPIKELTISIISYIFHSSSKKDDGEVPLVPLC